MSENITIRCAEEKDIPAILDLIKELARYEKAEDEVEATPELLHTCFFEDEAVEALLIDHEKAGVVGCAVFFRNFSTWTGRCGMYLEDLYIKEEYRRSGTGRALMAHLAAICEERGWARLDWSCLDWNTPSLGFYKSIGADPMTEWIHHRLAGEALSALAAEAK